MTEWVIRIRYTLYDSSADVCLVRATQDEAEISAVAIITQGYARVELKDGIEFIPLHRIESIFIHEDDVRE